ncbi:MAG: putative membrane protein [Bermanella sp.]|jgi:uncharacterized membrane protein|uniref:hypothetical protein n=1 Tax=Glaciecola sp. 33A TaxID=2057807 RepID=UPI000C3293B6|nr:hypothetical protein [Glaciecola sp. 33A]PKI00257.1 hypothetical protein CXF81_19090 [Glaciecola sp. 33A]
MNKAPSQNYNLDIKRLFERGNTATKQNYSVILRCMFILLFIALAAFVVLFNMYNIETVVQLEEMQTETYFFNMLLTVFMSPLMAGISMLAVKTERKQPINVMGLFMYVPFILWLATAELIVSLLTQVGMTLFILPAIYIFISTIFTKFLIADKQLRPFTAIKLSIQMCNRYLLQLTILFVIFVALFLLGIVTFGLAFIWIVPLYYNVIGILYNDLFGVQEETQQVQPVANLEETHFDA